MKAGVTRTALCIGQVIKKSAPCLGPNVSAGNGPRWRFKDTPTAAIFAAKVQISTSESGPKWRFRSRKAATTFLLFMHQYGRSFLLTYIEKMAACIFIRLFIWQSSDDRNLSILFPPTL